MEDNAYKELRQAFDIMSRDMLHSCVFLRFAVLPHLSPNEHTVLMAVWDRTSRFGRNDPIVMNYEDLIMGVAPAYCGTALIPRATMSKTRFYAAMQSLIKLGLLSKFGRNGLLITCYPYHYFDKTEKLWKKLLADKKRGETILASIEQGSLHYLDFVDSFLEKEEIKPRNKGLRIVGRRSDA